MRDTTRYRRMAVAAVSAAALLAAAACGDNGEPGGDDDNGNGEITIVLHDFGGAGFGYGDLVQQFMDENSGIVVDYQNTSDYDGEYRPNLLLELDAGTAPDVAAVEEGAIGQFMALNDAWVDLAEYGLEARRADYPDWKFELGYTNDGKLAVLGTDVGGMGICYRVDRFADAGLPTDRDEVAALWPDWDAFVATAQQYAASGVSEPFVDAPATLFNTRMIQAAGEGDGLTYLDRDGNFIAGQSPAVRTAFDLVMELHAIGQIGFETWSEDWFAAMDPGGFATMGCPGWMTGVVSDSSGEDNAGNWDFAPAPGVAGNWGGSWIGVTSSSQHPEEAAKLVDFLTSVEGQIGANEAAQTFPSAPAAQEVLLDVTNPYFNDAPVNQIVADSVAAYQPVFFGALHSALKNPMENVLQGVIEGTVSVDDAWDAFLAAGQEVMDLEG